MKKIDTTYWTHFLKKDIKRKRTVVLNFIAILTIPLPMIYILHLFIDVKYYSSQMTELACSWVKKFFYEDGGCWGKMDDCSLKEFEDEPCGNVYPIIRGRKVLEKLEEEIAIDVRNCFILKKP